MNITRTSQLSGVTRTLDLPITEEQFERWQHGALIQEAFPNLSKPDREFVMTGITAEEWDAEFSDEDEES